MDRPNGLILKSFFFLFLFLFFLVFFWYGTHRIVWLRLFDNDGVTQAQVLYYPQMIPNTYFFLSFLFSFFFFKWLRKNKSLCFLKKKKKNRNRIYFKKRILHFFFYSHKVSFKKNIWISLVFERMPIIFCSYNIISIWTDADNDLLV